MKKESVNKFDLEAAFKALEEIEIPVVKGVKPNRENLKEKFTKKLTSEILVEDYFDVSDQGDLEAAQEEREAEIAKAKLARIEKIVDLDAESEEDLLPSYVGKFIIQCPQCMTLFYKNQEDIEKSEENPEVVNINEVCQHCGNTSGYTLIGKVDNVGEEEAENYDVEDFDENELNLDFDAEEEPVEEESTEEEPVEDETAEEGNEEELELEPVEETEEENSEEEVKESLNETSVRSYSWAQLKKDAKELFDNLDVPQDLVPEFEIDEEYGEDAKAIYMYFRSNLDIDDFDDKYYSWIEKTEEFIRSSLPKISAIEVNNIGINSDGDYVHMGDTVSVEESDKGAYSNIVIEFNFGSLTEAVDKELDDKLKAHNEYIEYLKEMIEKEEKSLANAKNDFVKKSIQSRIDALKADLEAALPEALKGEVETELPTAEEIELEATENTEEKEETKESLKESKVVEVETDQLCSVVLDNHQMFVGSEKECKDYINKNSDPAVSARGGFKLSKTAKVPVAKEVDESLNETRTNDWVVIQHYYPTLCRKEQIREVTDALNQAVELFENETLGGIDEIEKEAKRISGIKDFSMLFMANYETINIPYGQPMTAEQYAKCVLDSDLSRTLYVVGVNVYGKPFRDELKKAGYDSTKALRLKESYGKIIDINAGELRREHSTILRDLLRKAKSNTKANIKLGDIDIDMDPWDELDFIGYITVEFYTKDGVTATNELVTNLVKTIEADEDLGCYVWSPETEFEPTNPNSTTFADDLIKHACKEWNMACPATDEEFAEFLQGEGKGFADYLSIAVAEKGFFDNSHHEDDELYESKTTKQRLTVIEPGYQYKDKDGNIYTLYGDEIEEDDTGITYDWEFVDDENGDIYIRLVESLTEDEEVGVKTSGDPKITYKIKYSYWYTDEQAQGDEPKVGVKTVSATSYEEAEDLVYQSLSINAKRPHAFTVLEVNDEKYDSFIKKLKKGTNAKDNAKESLNEDTAVKPRVRHQSRREIFSRELAAHPAFEGISTRDLERYIIDLYLEDDPDAELDVDQVIEYVEDLGWGKIILDNIDKLSEGQVRHFAQKDPTFVSTVKEFLGDWLLPNKNYSIGALVSELLVFLGKKPADREEAKDFNFDPNDISYKEFKDELADAYYEAKKLVPVGEALVGDVNINLDARGQSVGLLKGQGGEVHNDMTEGFEDICKKVKQKGFVEVKVELNPAEANKCEWKIKDDLGKTHYFTTPELAADLEKAYSRNESSEQLDEFIGPAVASIAGAVGAASVAKSAAGVVDSLVSEDVEGTTKVRRGSKVEYLAMELAKQDFFKGISVQIIQRILIPSYIEEFGRESLTAEEVTKYFSDYGFGGFVLDNYFDLSLQHVKTLGKQDPRFVETLRKYCEKHDMTPDEADYEKGHFNEFEELFDLSIGTVFEANGELETIEELQAIYKELVPVTESLQESGDLDTLLDSEEFKKPISETEVENILAKYESLEEDVEPGIESELAIQDIVDTWESVEEIDEESLDKLTENYLTEVYSNVKSFNTTDCSLAENKLVVEGKITFNSGKSKSTKFIYEATKTADNKLVLEGLNADFATEKAFVLNCNLDTANRLVVESLNYKYTINNTLVEGLTK